MRCYLITQHKRPKFYRVDGSIADIDLPYVSKKEFKTLNARGELKTQIIGGSSGNESSTIVNRAWMVSNTEDAITTLENADVYPFESKEAARQYARKAGILSFKYLPIL